MERHFLIGLLIWSCMLGFACEVGQGPTHGSTASKSNGPETNKGLRLGPEWQNVARVRTIDFTGAPSTLWLVTSTTYSVLRSSDGGKTWTGPDDDAFYMPREKRTWSGPDPIPAEIKGAHWLYFFDQNLGWIVDAKGIVWKTIDGGNSWQRTAALSKGINDTNYMGARQILFKSEDEGWIFEIHGAFYTRDSGNSWEKINPFRTDPEKAVAVGESNFWVLGTDDSDNSMWISKSTDGGRKWSAVRVADNCLAEDLFFLDNEMGWLSCSQGRLFKTTDGGEHWNLIENRPSDFEIKSIYWLNSERGWLAGYTCKNPVCSPMGGKAALFETSDSGNTWVKSNFENTDPFYSQVYFSDSKTGWLVSRDTVYKSADGGINWRAAFSPPF